MSEQKTTRIGRHVPKLGDPRWHDWTRPLKSFLTKNKNGRSWQDLDVWKRKNNIRKEAVRHLIAWLEYHGEASYDYESKKWKATTRYQH